MKSTSVSKSKMRISLALRILGVFLKILMIGGALPLVWLTACTMLLERWPSPGLALMFFLLYAWAAATVICWEGDYGEWRNAAVPHALRWSANLLAALYLTAQAGHSALSIAAVIAIDLAGLGLGTVLHRYHGPFRTRAMTVIMSLVALGFWWAWGDATDPRGSAAAMFALVYTAGALLH